MFTLSICAITLFYFLCHYSKDMNYIQLYYVNCIYLSVYITILPFIYYVIYYLLVFLKFVLYIIPFHFMKIPDF